MKIMHTSDWHIGKKTENHDRLPEQAAVLDEICEIAQREGVELVLIAGDVFDTYVPSSDAEELFYEKVTKLAAGRAAVIIPGNHDDATRLCATSPLAERNGIYFSGNIHGRTFANEKSDGSIYPCESGEGYAIFKNAEGEEVYLGLLPYPTEARFREKSDDATYSEKMVGWMNNCLCHNTRKLPQILVSHLFALGGVTTSGEREISLGGAKAVDKNDFPECDYIALGHLHKRQVIDGKKNIIYSGSILQYAFDEVNVEKSVTVFDISADGVKNLHVVPLVSGKRLAKISACSVEQAKEILRGYENYLVELTLKLKSPLNREENAFLHSECPNVISLKLEVESTGEGSVRGRRELSDGMLFEECYKKQYGVAPDDDLKELYLSLLEEVSGR